MDTIRFVIEDYFDRENGFRSPNINIYINGHNFIDLVEEIEYGRHKAQNGKTRSQSYVGLHPNYYYNYAEEFLGLQQLSFSTLLVCTCLTPECNSIVAKVVFDSNVVVWSEIRSPFLSSNTPNPWTTVEDAVAMDWYPIDYSGLGPFVFDRIQYLDALDALRKNLK